MATQMKLKVFIWKEITWPPGLLERKNNNKVLSFSALFFMFTLTWITGKGLERVIENKGDIFLLEEQHENFVAAVTKCEMLAATNAR